MLRLTLFVALITAADAAVAADAPGAKITFKKTTLDRKFRSEGVSVADFNKDGKLDIAAGRVYYSAPDWKMHSLEKTAREHDPNGYSGSFCNFAEDLNGDGWPDQIVIDFPGTPTYWYENPKKPGEPWTRHVAAPVSNNESPTYLDLDGDGKRELVMAVAPSSDQSDGPDRQMAFLKPDKDLTAPWRITPISRKAAAGTTRYSHGLGVGDMNRDGKLDVLVPQGWWEAPADKTTPWKFHDAKLGEACAQMHVYDFDGDGDNDVLSSSAHAYGVWWHEPTKDSAGKAAWKTHEIDATFSQSHSLVLADIDGDGLPDFVTGKRWWAHGPKGDVGADQPAVLCWFKLQRDKGKPVWTMHTIDRDSGIGTQFEVVDLNGDGKLDVVTSNKKGVFCFEQQRE